MDVARSTVGVMGLTFKKIVGYRNSKVIDLIRELETWNIAVSVSDPWADPAEVKRGMDQTSKNERITWIVGHNCCCWA